jgi:hypothetical protein
LLGGLQITLRDPATCDTVAYSVGDDTGVESETVGGERGLASFGLGFGSDAEFISGTAEDQGSVFSVAATKVEFHVACVAGIAIVVVVVTLVGIVVVVVVVVVVVALVLLGWRRGDVVVVVSGVTTSAFLGVCDVLDKVESVVLIDRIKRWKENHSVSQCCKQSLHKTTQTDKKNKNKTLTTNN